MPWQAINDLETCTRRRDRNHWFAYLISCGMVMILFGCGMFRVESTRIEQIQRGDILRARGQWMISVEERLGELGMPQQDIELMDAVRMEQRERKR